MDLSNRLRAVADMVSPGSRVCDIGCDHGYVPIYLVRSGISPKVIAMDVNRGPLLRAKEHIAAYHLENYIETRLSDGLSALKQGEADTVICAGMGGRLMQRILTAGEEKVRKLQEMILQPQSEIDLFRTFIRQQGYTIVQENMIWEEGKFYPMMRVIPKKAEQEPDGIPEGLADKFGGKLLEERHHVLIQYLEEQETKCKQVLEKLENYSIDAGKQTVRKREIRQELQAIADARKYMAERARLVE